MQATLCDRCGKAFEPARKGSRKYSVREIKDYVVRKQKSRGTNLDLCPECYDEFVRWFEKE